MDYNEIFPEDRALDSEIDASELLDSGEDQLYQSFSPFDLSEILSREAEMIDRHYEESRGSGLWNEEKTSPFKSSQYVKRRR
jgi:hypothetical protein